MWAVAFPMLIVMNIGIPEMTYLAEWLRLRQTLSPKIKTAVTA
jgi:hypothetical protein